MSEPNKIPIRQAKPNAADLEMAKSLLIAFHNIFAGYMPEDDDDLGEDDDDGAERLVDFDDDENAAKALRAVLTILLRGSLDRCVWSLVMLLDPANAVVDPDAEHVAMHPRFQKLADERYQLRKALQKFVDDFAELVSSSEGIAGLHHNGDVATWAELDMTGQFASWIGEAFAGAKMVLAKTGGEGR